MPRPKKEPHLTRVFIEGPRVQPHFARDREFIVEVEIRFEESGYYRTNERSFQLRSYCNYYAQHGYSEPLFMGLAVPSYGHCMDLEQLKERVKWLEEVLGFARRQPIQPQGLGDWLRLIGSYYRIEGGMTGTVHLRNHRDPLSNADVNEFATWQNIVYQAEQGYAQLKPEEEERAD